ncbi:MAG: hypothetical protein J6V14_02235, partial [Clostridia bacterium]|nr:hypothetical protein [Clostridia bacterium]
TVNKGEIGLAYDKGLTPASGKTLNVTLLQTDDLDNDQWVHRGNVYEAARAVLLVFRSAGGRQ